MKLKLLIPSVLLLLSTAQTMTAAVTYRIFATREGLVGGTTANGTVITASMNFVALPSRTVLNAKGGYTYTVNLRNPRNGKVMNNIPIWDIGPWNCDDNYWAEPRSSIIQPPLPRGKPQAQAARLEGHHGGKDFKSSCCACADRTVANQAGIDFSEGVWFGLSMTGNDYVDVTFNWVNIAPPPERVDTFVRGPGDNLYIRSYNNGTWFDWANLGGGLTSDPSSVSWGANRIDVFVRGPGNNLYLKSYDNGTWFGWANLGETLVGAPDAASWGPGNINVFWRGTDNALWFKQYSGGVWNPAARLGGTLTSDPAAVSWGPNRVDVFFRGPTGTCDTVTWNGTSWVWWSLGGGITDGPDVCSWGPGRLDVFARGSDNALWIRSYENGWFNWASLGGNFTSGPGATARRPGILDAFIRNPDGTMAQADWNGSAWTWSNKGGGLTGGPDACSWTNP